MLPFLSERKVFVPVFVAARRIFRGMKEFLRLKVYAISDLHMSAAVNKPMNVFGACWDNYLEKVVADWKEKVSDDDLVLMPGDFSWAMKPEEVKADFDLLKDLRGSKVILRGNHDYWWNTLNQVRSILPEGFYALQNDALRFGDVIVCGTRGWMCPGAEKLSEHDTKIYLRETERLRLSLRKMAEMRGDNDKVVCIMHYPPFNVYREESDFVRLFIEYGIKTVVYGHLHGKDCRADKYIKRFGAEFYLVSTDIVDHTLVEIPL